LDESDTLLTSEEVRAIKESKPYVEGLKAIIQAGEGKFLSQQEFTLARDLLLVRFATDNATRPGPLNNAKLKDYETAEISEGNRIMLISKHKRAKDGPAVVGMKPDLQKLMEIYVNKIRPQVASKEEEHLFVTVNGKQFPEGTIGRRVSSFFEKTKLRLGKRLAHVSVRKFVSTKTKESGTQRVMAHSSKTADRSYVRTNLTKLGSQALNIIERLTAQTQSHGDQKGDTSAATSTLEKSGKVETVAAPEEQDDRGQKGDTNAVTSTLERSANVDTVAPTEEHDNDEDSDDHHETPEPVLTTQVPPASTYSVSLLSSPVLVPPTPVRGLSEKEKAAILRVFEREIRTGTKVTKETAQKRCCTTAVLALLATSMTKVKKVVNHVNYIINTRPRSLPNESEQSTSKVHKWLQDFDDPSTRSSGRRQEWDIEESQAIEKAFAKFHTLPSTAEIKHVLKQDTKLYAILHREEWTRVYTKVKNIFKKKNRQ